MGWEQNPDRPTKKRSAWPWIISVAVVMIGVGIALTCKRNQECLDRGIDYFKSIGSWPTLTDGRSSRVVAYERCQQNDNAFGPW